MCALGRLYSVCTEQREQRLGPAGWSIKNAKVLSEIVWLNSIRTLSSKWPTRCFYWFFLFCLPLKLHVTITISFGGIMSVDPQGLWTLVWVQCSRQTLQMPLSCSCLSPRFALCTIGAWAVQRTHLDHQETWAVVQLWPSILARVSISNQPKISHPHLLSQLQWPPNLPTLLPS